MDRQFDSYEPRVDPEAYQHNPVSAGGGLRQSTNQLPHISTLRTPSPSEPRLHRHFKRPFISPTMSTWNESLEKGLLIHLLDLDVQVRFVLCQHKALLILGGSQIPRARFQAVAEQMGHGLTGEACR